MSAKPTIVPRFDTSLANILAPSGSRLTNGYPFNSTFPSGDANWLFHYLGEWAQYVSDGDLAARSFFLAGPQTYSMGVGSTNNADFNGASNANIGCVSLTWSGSTSASVPRYISGIAGGVDGRVLILTNNEPSSSWSSHRVALSHTDLASFSQNQILLPGGGTGLKTDAFTALTIPQGGSVMLRYDAVLTKWVVVAASFAIRTSTRTQVVPITPAITYVNCSPAGAVFVGENVTSAGGAWYFATMDLTGLAPGNTIVGIMSYAKLISTNLTIALYQKAGISPTLVTSTNIGSGLAVSGVAQEFVQTGLVWTIQDTCSYLLKISGLNSAEAIYNLQLQVASQNA